MNKGDLIEALAEQTSSSKAEAGRVIDGIFDTIVGALKKGDQVAIAGFGTFQVKDRAARQGRNPRTREVIQIPASKAPTFKASKTLKDAVN